MLNLTFSVFQMDANGPSQQQSQPYPYLGRTLNPNSRRRKTTKRKSLGLPTYSGNRFPRSASSRLAQLLLIGRILARLASPETETEAPWLQTHSEPRCTTILPFSFHESLESSRLASNSEPRRWTSVPGRLFQITSQSGLGPGSGLERGATGGIIEPRPKMAIVSAFERGKQKYSHYTPSEWSAYF